MEEFAIKETLVDCERAGLVRKYVPGREEAARLCGFFAALGDGTRLRLISALSITPLCVSDVVTLLGINQTTVSHQLAALKAAGAVKSRRQGRVVFYSLADRRLLDVMLLATQLTAE